ncbi:MAG: GTP 3',8-cyclase MoaA [Helicobacteraceae bacterium]|jgi:cyclic pyranopterin phosphate synthase|nr:GTP 3',8-cyclase MoaA [Helicobacteraceae bacterium]
MLIDANGRAVDYLRVSVTERCNFRCLYCMPDKPLSWVPHSEILRYEEMILFIRAAIDCGVKKVRITGGEPTLRGDLDVFIKMIADYAPNIDLAMTTNGFLFSDLALKFKNAGLKRVNISLDSLKRDVAGKIANRDVLLQTLKGIEAAIAAGLQTKINVVPMKGINDGEICDILERCKSWKVSVRFIEYMDNSHANKRLRGMRSDEILAAIKARYEFEEIERDCKSPSRLFKLPCGYVFGLIEPHRDEFCASCNRVRLTAEGLLAPCLYFDEAKSIKAHVKRGDGLGAIGVLREILAAKREKNRFGEEASARAFYETGG